MGLFSKPQKSIYEMSDRELLRYISRPPFGSSMADQDRAIEEAARRGLRNPKTGRPYQG